MSNLAVIVVGGDAGRARSALGIAAAAAALGRTSAVLFDGPSVGCLGDVADALSTALEMGVAVTACATGIADCGQPVPAGVETGGMIAFLSLHRDAQVLAV